MKKIALISSVRLDRNDRPYFIITTEAGIDNGMFVAPKSIFVYGNSEKELNELHAKVEVGMEIA